MREATKVVAEQHKDPSEDFRQALLNLRGSRVCLTGRPVASENGHHARLGKMGEKSYWNKVLTWKGDKSLLASSPVMGIVSSRVSKLLTSL